MHLEKDARFVHRQPSFVSSYVAHCLWLHCLQPMIVVKRVCEPLYTTIRGKGTSSASSGEGDVPEELADHAGLHRTHVSLIERGQQSVRLETIERLASGIVCNLHS